MRASLLDFFPTPAYLAPPILGLDISDTSVKFVELLRRPGGFELGRYGEKKLSEAALDNGKIQKPDELLGVLGDLHTELRLRTVMISVMEEQGYLLRLRVPVQTEAEIREGIELQLDEHIPFPPSEVIFDYEIISAPADAAAYYDVSVSAFPREIVDSYFDIVSSAGFEPLALEIESQSLGRSLVSRGDASPSMIIDFGRNRTGIAIVSDGVVAFSSTLPMGGENFTHIIEKELGLTHEKAEEVKYEKGISRRADDKNFFSLFVPALTVFKEEIGKHYTYWHSHPYESGVARKKIERIILCGRGANMRGIQEYLSSVLGVPVSVGSPWANSFAFSYTVPAMNLSDSLGYTAAIGLALRAFNERGEGSIQL